MKEKKDYLILYLAGVAPTIVSLSISIFIKVDIKPKKEPDIIKDNANGEEEVIKNKKEDETETE